MQFDEVEGSYERLREGIVRAYAGGKGLTPQRLLDLAQDHYAKLLAEAAIAEMPKLPGPSDVARFRDGTHRTIRSARPLWDFILHYNPQLLGIELPTEAGFINGLLWYYGVNRQKMAGLARQLGNSTFLVYHFTEMLADTHPDAVVEGEVTITRPDTRLLHVTERQSYDGKLGKRASTETNAGYCFPKFQSVCMLLKGPAHAPKLYDFHRFGEEGDQISWMKGRLARVSQAAPLFVSNAYAIRVPKDHGTAMNIHNIQSPDHPLADILAELKKD